MNLQTPGDRAWSDLDLEALHDGELEAASAAELSRALMQSPALRERLAAITRTDAAVLAGAGVPAVPQRRAAFGAPLHRAALAAAALLACSAAAILLVRSPSPRPAASPAVAIAAQPGPRIVLSIDLPNSTPPRLAAAPVREPVPVTPSAAPEHIGPLPLSSAEVQRRLEGIPAPQDRLAACIAWAREKRQSPLIFDHLELLAAQPGMRERVVGALRDLALLSDLRPYARQTESRIQSAERASRG